METPSNVASETPLGSTTPAADRLRVRTRVQRFRAKLHKQDCRRLEVCIGVTVIENIRRIAKYKRQQTWEVIQQAFETYVTAYIKENQLPVRRLGPEAYIKRVR